MKAVHFHTTGDSSVLELEDDVPITKPKVNEVLILTEYAGVNSSTPTKASGLSPITLPEIAGREGADTIIEIGDEVAKLYGFKLPPCTSTSTGAAVLLQGLTAGTLAQNAHKVEKGQTVLIQAAAGGQGAHAVFSGIGNATFATDLPTTLRKGTLASYGNSSGPVTACNILDLSKKNVKLVRPTLANYISEPEEFKVRSEPLLSLVSGGEVKVPLGGEYEIENLWRAQDDLAGQRSTGKLIVQVAQT
ncbi:hypothetical protein BJX64DRAFT_277615 [Aspergillus heterothallicus]